MNRYARIAQRHWQDHAPSRVGALPDPIGFFTALGAEVEAQVNDLATRIASMPTERCSPRPYWVQVARLQTARRTAEEVVMAQLVWITNPELPLDQAREEWEQTRVSDENLIAWAERMQNYPDSMPSTAELEEMAKTWALSVEFLEALVASEPPREYVRSNRPVVAEAASIRFLRELSAES